MLYLCYNLTAIDTQRTVDGCAVVTEACFGTLTRNRN